MSNDAQPRGDEIVTAALLVIGDEILSGRTKDKNIGHVADHLTAIGIQLKEVRIVPDEEAEIVAAVNALRARYTYLFTTGGIGPTHDDITADCGGQGVRRRHRRRRAGAEADAGLLREARRGGDAGAAQDGAHPVRRRAGGEQRLDRAGLHAGQRHRDGRHSARSCR